MCGSGAAPELDRQLRLGGLRTDLAGVDAIGSELGQLGAGQRLAGGLGDPPPVRVPSVECGLDQGRVRDRPGDALGLVVAGGSADLDPPDT